jgi:predicted nucleic acid-binding protein
MNAVDTNILFYAHDSRDPQKQRIASELIAAAPDGALIWQVACEYLWASRLEAGIRHLFSENFSGYTRVESLEVVNPFRVPA